MPTRQCCILLCVSAGHPTLPLVTNDIIELTIYSDITHINIANHLEIGDMSIAALSLLPKLGVLQASGSSITNLGLIIIASARTVTQLDLSKYGPFCILLFLMVAPRTHLSPVPSAIQPPVMRT